LTLLEKIAGTENSNHSQDPIIDVSGLLPIRY